MAVGVLLIIPSSSCGKFAAPTPDDAVNNSTYVFPRRSALGRFFAIFSGTCIRCLESLYPSGTLSILYKKFNVSSLSKTREWWETEL